MEMIPMFKYNVAQQAVMILMMSLFSRTSVYFSIPQNCTRMRLRTPKIIKFSLGSMPPDPP